MAKRKYGFSFSWKRAVGLSGLKQRISRKTGIPMTKFGMERKIGASIIKALLSLVERRKK